jgi:hypothetical protein
LQLLLRNFADAQAIRVGLSKLLTDEEPTIRAQATLGIIRRYSMKGLPKRDCIACCRRCKHS